MFWKSSTKNQYQGRHIKHEPVYDAFAGIFGRRRHAFAIIAAAGAMLTTVHVVESGEKPPATAETPAYQPNMVPETNRHITVGRGILNRCNDEALPTERKKAPDHPITLAKDKAGKLVGNTIDAEQLTKQVSGALVSMKQPAGLDAETGKMRYSQWNGVAVQAPGGRTAVIGVSHGVIGKGPIVATDSLGNETTVERGCYIYQAGNKQMPVHTYPAPQHAAPRNVADIDLSVMFLQDRIGESALPLAASSPEAGDFAMLASLTGEDNKPAGLTVMATAERQPVIELLAGIDVPSPSTLAYNSPRPGWSGGPVVNAEGAVAGILFGSAGKPLNENLVGETCGVQVDPSAEDTSPTQAYAMSAEIIEEAINAAMAEDVLALRATE